MANIAANVVCTFPVFCPTGAWKLFSMGTPPPCVFGECSACHGLVEKGKESPWLYRMDSQSFISLCACLSMCVSLSRQRLRFLWARQAHYKAAKLQPVYMSQCEILMFLKIKKWIKAPFPDVIYKGEVIDWCSDGWLSLILRKVCFLPAHVALGLIRALHVETPGCPVLCRASAPGLSLSSAPSLSSPIWTTKVTHKLGLFYFIFFWGVLKHEQFLRWDHGTVTQCWCDRGKRCTRKEMLEEGKTLQPCPSWAPTHDTVSGDQLETLCCTVTDSSACCRGEVTGLAAAFQLLQYFQFLIPSSVPDSPFLVTLFLTMRGQTLPWNCSWAAPCPASVSKGWGLASFQLPWLADAHDFQHLFAVGSFFIITAPQDLLPCLATFGLICWFLSLLLLKSFGLPFFFFKVHLFFCSCSSCPLSTLWGLIANVGRSRVIPGWKMLPGYCFNPTKTMNQCLLVSLAPHECRSRKSTQPGKALGMLTNVLLNQT